MSLKKKYALAMMGMMLMPGSNVLAEEMSPYIGVGLGAFGLEYSEPGFKQRNTVFGGFVKGGVDINDYVGIEIRLGATGKGDKTYPAGTLGAPVPFTVALKSDYLVSYLAKLQFPVAEDFRLYALIGATRAKISRPSTIGAVVVPATANKTGFSYGVGGDYSVGGNLSAGAEWVQYWNNAAVGVNMKAKMWGAAATLTSHF